MRGLCPIVCLVLLAALMGGPEPTSSKPKVHRPAEPARPGAPAPEPARAPASRVTAPPGEPSTAPMLRLETGMHTTAIRQIGVDMAQCYLMTGLRGQDRTGVGVDQWAPAAHPAASYRDR